MAWLGLLQSARHHPGLLRQIFEGAMAGNFCSFAIGKVVPFGTTTDSLIASVESAIQKNKVKIGSISDFTGDAIEIELTLPRGTYAEEVIPQLYAYTDCEIAINSSLTVIESRHPVSFRGQTPGSAPAPVRVERPKTNDPSSQDAGRLPFSMVAEALGVSPTGVAWPIEL